MGWFLTPLQTSPFGRDVPPGRLCHSRYALKGVPRVACLALIYLDHAHHSRTWLVAISDGNPDARLSGNSLGKASTWVVEPVDA